MIRVASANDIPEMLGIYAPYIEKSAVSFELEVPGEPEFLERMLLLQKKYPWLEEDGKIAGYAYAAPYRERKAYQWSVETSVYICPSRKGSGVASELYGKLLHQLSKLGYHLAYAIITLPNPASEKFHKKMGFENVGIFPEAGYKLGRWHDVKWMLFRLQPAGALPLSCPEKFSGLC
jgi:L-amino acid N-acyltransferase YncA